MSCVEKRHFSHRMGSMLHHRFPNGFTDLFMDETDREVSSLTDRAFRSLCVGDDAVYSDEFLPGYSPFSCHKPLAGEPLRKNQQKAARQHKHDRSDAKPWKQQQKEHMSSLLRALSAAEESCEEMLMRNGVTADSNGDSWDKSALRSIQKELSEFSSSYQSSLADNHQAGSSNKAGKDVGLPSGKSAKCKNGKAAVKLRKLNIKNLFLHSELSPFQTWTDLNRFPFSQDDAVSNILAADIPPKWYDLPFYKELTGARRPAAEETQTRPILPKPAAPPTEKRCSSEGGEGSAAPWRRNRSRAKSALPANHAGNAAQDTNPKAADEALLSFKKEVKSAEVKAVEEVSSLASTPFSICQLMTPIIPSRQPTETSEVLQAVLSPSASDLPGRSQSEAKGTPEPPVKRETYKSLASSILFNLKDNRKRVKSRYSPPKFRALELPEEGSESPLSEELFHAGSEGNASGLKTPAFQVVWHPILEDSPKQAANKPLSDDYLLTNLLQNKWDENSGSPLKHRKANKSPMTKKQNYPSLSLYRKASPVSDELKAPPESLSSGVAPHADPPNDGNIPTNLLPKNTPLSASALTPIKDHPTASDRAAKRPPEVPEKTKRPAKGMTEKGSEGQTEPKRKETDGPTVSAMDVIRAAREAISAAKNKGHSDPELPRGTDDHAHKGSLEPEGGSKKKETFIGKNSSKEPPPVPKRNFTKADIQPPRDKHSTHKAEKSHGIDSKEPDSDPKERKEGKHAFSARQNNYIKNQRCAEKVDDGAEEDEEGHQNVEAGMKVDEGIIAGERRDGRLIVNNLQALKELERARLSDRMKEKDKLEVQTIEEEAKAQNDLICRQLQNIKKEMLSMRGNTSAKMEIFAKKEKSKQETFPSSDANVNLNKKRVNDNYDKAKMALEEVISERERRRRTESKDQDTRSRFPNSSPEKTFVQRDKTELGSTRKPQEPKDGLSVLKEHHQQRPILSQTEPGETQRAGGMTALPGMDRFTDSQRPAANHEKAKDHVFQKEEKKLETPPVPPRSKKGHKRDESTAKEKDQAVCHKQTELREDLLREKPSGSETSPEETSVCGFQTHETSSTVPESEGSTCLSPKVRAKDVKKRSFLVKTSPMKEGDLCISEAQETSAIKQKVSSKPEHGIPSGGRKNPKPEEEQDKGTIEDTNVDAEGQPENPRNFVSPLLQVNGIPLPQSPPDQASLSSKSSYFSVESTLHRNTETESNIYHSLETLTGELEEVDGAGGSDSGKPEVESFSDQEVTEEILKPPKEPNVQENGRENVNEKSNPEETESTSSNNTSSPTLGILALFRVKDNSFRLRKAVPPWSPKGNRSERAEELHLAVENPELYMGKDILPNSSAGTEVLTAKDTSSDQTTSFSPSNLQTENTNKPQLAAFLAVPQEEDGLSRLTPSSEGVDSGTTSTADTVNEVVTTDGAPAEHAEATAPSEPSGSTCSGNDSQPGLPKPPAVLPKTEKAVLKAIKLTNRRMKKEEAQKIPKSSQSRGKSKAERHRHDKSDHKGDGAKLTKTDERKHGEPTGDRRHCKEGHPSKPTKNHPNPAEANQPSLRQIQDPAESSRGRERRSAEASDSQGHSGPEQRDYSRDRVISNIPVYKAHVGERSASDRPFHRSQSIDRYLEGKAERRLSADVPATDPRTERMEKSIRDELHQRGRAKDKPTRENPLRRSHSIDAYGAEARHPSSLSRQSSHSGKFSRQSSMEHAIVTQSFPMAQRKILQDPDSGQYFFVDLPVQVKTKTFFDPETASYVQLPVQPPDGAFPQPSAMEVLTPPLVVYHSFVPVPLSPMAQKATIHAPHVEPHERRHTERSRPLPCMEGRPYLESAYGQHQHLMVGDFLGTEELDCPS